MPATSFTPGPPLTPEFSPLPESSPRSRGARLVEHLKDTLCGPVSRYFQHLLLRELPWAQRFAPAVLRPDFTWRHRVLVPGRLSLEIPPSPLHSTYLWRWITGQAHSILCDFSRYYCAWFGIPYHHNIASLPFGLLLKWSDGTSLDEVQSMRAIRAAGIPAPRVISYGEHPDTPHAAVSILMTRLPGEELQDVYERLERSQRDAIGLELQVIFDAMRSWENPWGQRICSISGRSIRSIRVPNHRIECMESESEFNDFLLSAASSHSHETQEAYDADVATALKMQALSHRIVFTHGDFAFHNIMVHNGHVSGLIDWECAGWYPEYWEFTTPLRWPSRFPDKGALVLQLGGSRYEEELLAERALVSLTVDSWVCI